VEVRVQQGDITAIEADVAIVNLFEGVTAPGGGTGAADRALEGAISRLIELGDLKGKSGETVTLYSNGQTTAPRVLVAGLGKAEEFSYDAIRNLSANLMRSLRKTGIKRAATLAHGAGIGGLNPKLCARAIAEGAILGSYRFTRFKGAGDQGDNAANNGVETVVIVEHDQAKLSAMQEGVAEGTALAEATNLARDLANTPANHLTPTILAEKAREVAEAGELEFEVLEEADAEKKGMGSFLSVARGSNQAAKMIRMSYRPVESEGYGLALVGKGITFDTGGISIKPAANMDAMKADMTGAASVIGAMQAIAALKPQINIVAIAPLTENMPSGTATKPGDVVTAMNGKTIEVLNTDAEGRLVLADAVCWAKELGARRIVDVATLTGAVTTALGDVCYGLMTNNDELASRFEAAATVAGEKTWRLPMFSEYDELINSDVADIKNIGTANRGAGTIVGAKFIERFVGDTPWVHLDIAGVDNMSADKGWISKGASGMSVRPMVHLAFLLAK
jgi:leucyl aminopeptidase